MGAGVLAAMAVLALSPPLSRGSGDVELFGCGGCLGSGRGFLVSNLEGPWGEVGLLAHAEVVLHVSADQSAGRQAFSPDAEDLPVREVFAGEEGIADRVSNADSAGFADHLSGGAEPSNAPLASKLLSRDDNTRRRVMPHISQHELECDVVCSVLASNDVGLGDANHDPWASLLNGNLQRQEISFRSSPGGTSGVNQRAPDEGDTYYAENKLPHDKVGHELGRVRRPHLLLQIFIAAIMALSAASLGAGLYLSALAMNIQNPIGGRQDGPNKPKRSKGN